MTQDIEALAKEIATSCKTAEDFTEFFKQLKRRGLEAALAGELTAHLGYEKHSKAESPKDNSRNGYSKKRIKYVCIQEPDGGERNHRSMD